MPLLCSPDREEEPALPIRGIRVIRGSLSRPRKKSLTLPRRRGQSGVAEVEHFAVAEAGWFRPKEAATDAGEGPVSAAEPSIAAADGPLKKNS